jgi:hypothetical protein
VFVDAQYQVPTDNITLTVTAASMTVHEDLSVEVFMTRSTDWSTGALDSINKPSDMHRANLFIRDGNDDDTRLLTVPVPRTVPCSSEKIPRTDRSRSTRFPKAVPT